MVKKPKRSQFEKELYRKFPHIVWLTQEQVDYFTQLGIGNMSAGVRTFIHSFEWPDLKKMRVINDKRTAKVSIRKGISLCDDENRKLLKYGTTTGHGIQLAWINYVCPKLVHFFRD